MDYHPTHKQKVAAGSNFETRNSHEEGNLLSFHEFMARNDDSCFKEEVTAFLAGCWAKFKILH